MTINLLHHVFNGVTDSIVQVGHNCHPITGAAADPARAQWVLQLEDDYFDGRTHWNEINLDFRTANGGEIIRPLMIKLDRDNPSHYTGCVLCAKGNGSVALVCHSDVDTVGKPMLEAFAVDGRVVIGKAMIQESHTPNAFVGTIRAEHYQAADGTPGFTGTYNPGRDVLVIKQGLVVGVLPR